MTNRDHILNRLFHAAAGPGSLSEMPFGFDTRVLALAREPSSNGSAVISLFARRAAIISLAVIALASAGLYQTSISNNDLPVEYAMADRVIENNLGQ